MFRLKWSGDPNRRAHAAEALGHNFDAGAYTALVKALNDPAARVRRAAAWALGNLGDTRAIDPLIGALAETEGTGCTAVVRALDRLDPKREWLETAVQSLTQVAQAAEDPRARERATRALASLDRPEAYPTA